MGTDRIEPEKRLRRDVESALRRALDPSDVLPMLHRLARTAAPGSEERVFAHRQLAELLAEKNPWRAAIYARRVTTERPDDDRGWALLGLSQTLLGHYRFAVSAYEKALSRAPRNPWYAHNLGHLLDVALDRAGDALTWLRAAHTEAAGLESSAMGDIAASLAHALGRAGQVGEAKEVLAGAMKRGASREHEALLHWLERGAPPAEDAGGPGGGSAHAAAPDEHRPMRAATKRVRPAGSTARSAASLRKAVDSALARGLERLPLDDKQRARARELAMATGGGAHVAEATAPTSGARSVAAAIAYAVVFVDRVPLTPAEVAATFRVSPAALRGRFGELRARLDLHPGDARFATRP